MRVFFLLFIILPIAELMLLIKVGQALGALPTIGLLLLVGAVGVFVLRHQSVSTLKRAQQRMKEREVPGQEMFEGLLISFSGILLLLPGFLTDLLALFLLLPVTRRALVTWLLNKGQLSTLNAGPGAFIFNRFGGSGFTGAWPPQGRPGGQDIYEGEFTREGEHKTSLKGPNDPSGR